MDGELARRVDEFPGKVVLAGGTTANIIGRELGRPVEVDLSHWDPDIPPPAVMEGADLVTEGMLTLSRVLAELELNNDPSFNQPYGVRRFLELLTDSDRIFFLVGTKINEAHQDPHIPQEMEIRRSIVRRICRCLEEKYWKKTCVEFI